MVHTGANLSSQCTQPMDVPSHWPAENCAGRGNAFFSTTVVGTNPESEGRRLFKQLANGSLRSRSMLMGLRCAERLQRGYVDVTGAHT